MCGDEVELGLKLSSDKCTVEDVRFSGRGCVISQVSASMLTERIKGKSVEEVSKLSKEDVLKLLGIEISAMRLKCALLGLKVLKIGVYDHLGKQAERNGLDEGIF
jgi:nitrogen fixation NifU-like protein